MKKKPVILGIESSCDETAVAVLRENKENIPEILSNEQLKIKKDENKYNIIFLIIRY